MKTAWLRWLLIFMLSTLALGVAAQDDDIADGFKKLDAAVEQRLRMVLAESVPQGASKSVIQRMVKAKVEAGIKLGDDLAVEAALRESVALGENSANLYSLGLRLFRRDETSEGMALMARAVTMSEDFGSAWNRVDLGCKWDELGQTEKASSAFAAARKWLDERQPQARQPLQKHILLRAQDRLAYCLSKTERKLGHTEQAIALAQQALSLGRQALEIANANAASASFSEMTRFYARESVADDLLHRLYVEMAGNSISAAEQAMAEYLRFVKDDAMAPRYLGYGYQSASKLRFLQRQFESAETYAELAGKTFASVGRTPLDANMRDGYANRLSALEGQQRWADALREFERIDALAGSDKVMQGRVRLGWLRGVVYLHVGKFKEAAQLFKQNAANDLKIFGPGHFNVAFFSGLQGVALWRMATPESQAQARPLLKETVRDLMAPQNADYLTNTGTRKERREEIFAAYLEAMTTLDPISAMQALGPADWVRGGLVQEALGDAAVRAAASTPALAEQVRHDQDARNEIRGLRDYLAGEAGGGKSPLPSVAAQMRQRIATLEQSRVQWQAQIKASFPDYERLVRPTLHSPAEIAQRLKPDEALIVLQPTESATYVWALTKDGPGSFHRAAVTNQQLSAWVKTLRSSLDVAGLPADKSPTFAHSAAQALYAQLLAPVQNTLNGKTQLVVAAGGVLGQIPFAVLQTSTSAGAGATTTPLAKMPWLIHQAAITHVPSVAAWLAMRDRLNASGTRKAPDPLLAWGDPSFKVNLALAPVQQAQAATRNAATTNTRSVNLTRASTLLDLEALEKTSKVPSALNYADIPPLPETRDELLAIAQELGANPGTDLLMGERASRQSVLSANQSGSLGNKRVLAFATHGLMAGDLPNLTQPALALAASNTDAQNPLAPLLTLEDVLTLKLNADWVVLSACNTAAADGKAEEALSGLARGFFYAGSRSLLVTHWAVESESAKQLTTSTFAHYAANPQAPKAESLRQAMLKVMAQPAYSHPAYWAPYALVGDGGR